jgi:radical SAM-linked protein
MSEVEIRPDRPGEGAPAVVAQRIQFRFTKGPAVRFISHLDLMRTFERAMRRARLPLAFSQGFNPRPRISLYVPLPVGATSDAELGSVDLSERLEPGETLRRLNAVLPPAIQLLEEEEIPFEGGAHAASKIDTAVYEVEAVAPVVLNEEEVKETVETFLAAETWPYLRKSEKKEDKSVDLRQPVLDLKVLSVEADRAVFRMDINIGGEGGARPREVIAALAERLSGLEDRRIHRSRLYSRASDLPVSSNTPL